MPRLRIILLDKDRNDPHVYNFLLWADVPVARQARYAQPAGTRSIWTGATTTDNANLVNGVVVERAETVKVQEGITLLQAQTLLQQAWTEYQAKITTTNPWSRYGTTWDGTTWVAGGVS